MVLSNDQKLERHIKRILYFQELDKIPDPDDWTQEYNDLLFEQPEYRPFEYGDE